MPEYLCRVANAAGEVIERSYVASDEPSLRRDLEGQDLMLLSLRQRSSLFGGAGLSSSQNLLHLVSERFVAIRDQPVDLVRPQRRDGGRQRLGEGDREAAC